MDSVLVVAVMMPCELYVLRLKRSLLTKSWKQIFYLHYSLDLWYERKFRKTCHGKSRMIRYADDWVTSFLREGEAIRYRHELEGRLARFGLEVAPDKTKVLEFGPHAESRAKRRGTKPQNFDFLGFTHYIGRSKKGNRFRMKRVTSRKKYVVKVRMFKDWLKANRTLPTRELMKKVASKLGGHFAYYGVTDNSRGIMRFASDISKLLFKWLNRRGGRGRMSWAKYMLFLRKFPLPKPRIMVNLFASP